MRATASIGATIRRVLASSPFLDHAVRHRSGLICLVAVLTFVAVCVAMQWVRTDLDWWHDPLSAYLKGPHSAWVQAAYYGLSLGLILLGAGLYGALRPQARRAAPVLLLAVAGIGLALTAVTEFDLPYLAHAQESRLHKLAALGTFLNVTLGMLLQSWRFRDDAAWRQYFALAFCLAVACFIALSIYAFGRDLPRGFAQKSVIAMILLWLGFAAAWLRRAQSIVARRVQAPEQAGVTAASPPPADVS